MTVRSGFLARAAMGAAIAAALLLPGVFAVAQQIDMNVVDQPGYQPTPEEEQLSGAYEKQEVFFRTSEAPGTIVRCSTSSRTRSPRSGSIPTTPVVMARRCTSAAASAPRAIGFQTSQGSRHDD